MLFNTKARRRIDELEERLRAAIAANEEMSKHAFLIDITRSGRVNKFMFVRRKEIIVIETMGLISDDIGQWKKDLL